MYQTEARRILKDAPIMWRRINSIGIILDCNSTYAAKLGYAKSEILGKPIFEHVPKESWEDMNDSLQKWFETGKVSHREITFKRHDQTTFPALLHAVSLYDQQNNLIGRHKEETRSHPAQTERKQTLVSNACVVEICSLGSSDTTKYIM